MSATRSLEMSDNLSFDFLTAIGHKPDDFKCTTTGDVFWIEYP